MDTFCPECMGPLTSADGQTAVCKMHGGSYHILFTRFAIPGMPGTEVPGALGIDGPPALDVRCVKHPETPAVAYCHNCRAPACATCDFVFPGDIHVCPECVVNTRPKMSSGRRKLIPWSIGLGVLGILGLAGMLVVSATAVHSKSGLQAIGIIFELISFWPAVIGLALGVASFDKRLKTPGTVWIGIVGCGLVVLIWLMLILVGLSKQ